MCNILDYGAKGDGRTDDAAAFRRAINACKTIFLPNNGAPYILGSQIVLDANTSLFGEGYSTIALQAHAHGFQLPSQPKPMLVLPADPEATNRLVDLALTCEAGNPGAVLLEWGAGKAQSFDVHYRSGEPATGQPVREDTLLNP
eukprot:COSAG05_NODE_1223_length_5468_cov_31.139877_4_plen_144_part_00